MNEPLSIVGRIAEIGNKQSPTPRFSKVELVLDTSTNPKFNNYSVIEFVNKDIEKLQGFHVGEKVKVNFWLHSRRSKDGKHWFTTARGAGICGIGCTTPMLPVGSQGEDETVNGVPF